MKKCELCKFPARSYCESDQASLCWDCDAKVHAANFLVARHSRTLLCHTCQSVTPWKASGAKLGRTVSVCERCSNHQRQQQQQQSESTANDDNDDDGNDNDSEDGDGDNQVVPWSSTNTPPPAASASSSSSSSTSSDDGEFFDSVNVVSLKRSRQSSTDLRSLLLENINRSSSQREYGLRTVSTDQSGGDGGVGGATSVDYYYCYSLRPLKDRRTESDQRVQPGSRSAAIIERFHQSNSTGELSGESETVDVDESGNTSRTI